MSDLGRSRPRRTQLIAFGSAFPVGLLGGLIGLGGAEFRIPILRWVLHQPTRRAIPINMSTSLVTISASLAMRLGSGVFWPVNLVPVIVAMGVGSLAGAYCAGGMFRRLSERVLDTLICALLLGLGGLMIWEAMHPVGAGAGLSGTVALLCAAVLGVAIGGVCSILGIAGGELIIPALILVFGANIKAAGTASVLVSLPALLAGTVQHARSGLLSGTVLRDLVLPLGAGSLLGALLGGLLLPYADGSALEVTLAAVLLVSAARIGWETRLLWVPAATPICLQTKECTDEIA